MKLKSIAIILAAIGLLVVSLMLCLTFMEPIGPWTRDEYARAAMVVFSAAASGVLILFLMPDYDKRKSTPAYDEFVFTLSQMEALRAQDKHNSEEFENWQVVLKDMYSQMSPRERNEAQILEQNFSDLMNVLRGRRIIQFYNGL